MNTDEATLGKQDILLSIHYYLFLNKKNPTQGGAQQHFEYVSLHTIA